MEFARMFSNVSHLLFTVATISVQDININNTIGNILLLWKMAQAVVVAEKHHHFILSILSNNQTANSRPQRNPTTQPYGTVTVFCFQKRVFSFAQLPVYRTENRLVYCWL
jgi:hypothetical protein